MTVRSIATTTAFAALSLVAGTTFCAGVASAEDVATANAAPVKTAAVPLDERICAKIVLPGSRVASSVCQTRGTWISQQGVDPVAK